MSQSVNVIFEFWFQFYLSICQSMAAEIVHVWTYGPFTSICLFNRDAWCQQTHFVTCWHFSTRCKILRNLQRSAHNLSVSKLSKALSTDPYVLWDYICRMESKVFLLFFTKYESSSSVFIIQMTIYESKFQLITRRINWKQCIAMFAITVQG